MTSQPRDLAAEVQFAPDSTIAAIVKQLRDAGKPWADIDVDLRNEMTADWRKRIEHYAGLRIAALSRELEEATQAGIDTAREISDRLSGRIDELEAQYDDLEAESEMQREALRWALDNGVHHHAGLYYWPDTEPMRTTLQPPAHLAPILAEAMEEKS